MTPSKRQPPRVPPWEHKGEGETASFGTWLRRQREAREISLREIAETSKISLRYLEALEDDRFDVLPAPVFARGFLREYSKVVGLNPDEVVNTYLSALAGENEADEETKTETGRPRGAQRDWGYGLLLSLAVAFLLGLVALLAFWAERRRATTPPPQVSIAPPPAVVVPVSAPQPAAPAPAPESPLRVSLDFTA